MREHYRERTKTRRALAWEVSALTAGQRPLVPYQMARVRIWRHSTGNPDPDGLNAKLLLDILQSRSKVHPTGLGIIVNDNRERLVHEVIHVRIKPPEKPKTVVTIEDMSTVVYTRVSKEICI